MFGLLKRGGRVFTAIILDTDPDSEEEVLPGSIVYTDIYKA